MILSVLLLSIVEGTADARLDAALAGVTVTSAVYQCDDGRSLPVEYLNTDNNMLAIVPVQDQDTIFVNVVSASGARYVAGRHEWWSKGDQATLTRLDDPETITQCTAAPAD